VIFFMMHLWCIALRYYTVVTVIFRYYTVIVHDMGNRNMVKTAMKCQGNVKKFHGAGEWSPCDMCSIAS